MRLKSVQITKFRNMLDSDPVEIADGVTCLVGKNESGKTAFLHALHRLNPSRAGATFSVPDHYPAWLEKRDKMRGIDLERERPVTATFEIEQSDVDALSGRFGPTAVTVGTEVIYQRDYGNRSCLGVRVNEAAFVTDVVEKLEWPRGTKTEANSLKTVADLRGYAERLQASEDEASIAVSEAISASLTSRLADAEFEPAIRAAVEAMIPRFLYFAHYSSLPYSVPINRVLTADPSSLSEDEQTAADLLRIAAADDAYLKNPDYERRIRELENVANALTDDVLTYWTQNPELRVQPDITQKTVQQQNGQTAVLDELKIRIRDNRHSLSLPFDEHSTGFQWFFSFLAAFAKYEYSNAPVIILLDEPALGLHARAQGDFLRFIDERLAEKRQIIYTTHSPFMVKPGELDRVRLVEDTGKERGAKVSADVTTTDPDTLFPLQGALGYDLVQNLFIAPHNLVVEGTSDFTYLQVISDYFRAEGSRTPLREEWSIVPVGGVDLVPTFVALLGNHLDLTVLVDAKRGGHQKLKVLTEQGLLERHRIITPALITGADDADVEDLFDPVEYVDLYNKAFGSAVTVDELVGDDPIVRRLARHAGVPRFDHGLPADAFLRSRPDSLERLSKTTLDNFERLFEAVNATLPE